MASAASCGSAFAKAKRISSRGDGAHSLRRFRVAVAPSTRPVRAAKTSFAKCARGGKALRRIGIPPADRVNVPAGQHRQFPLACLLRIAEGDFVASDISLAVGGGVRRMTYAELAAVTGISAISAERLVRRRRWQRPGTCPPDRSAKPGNGRL